MVMMVGIEDNRMMVVSWVMMMVIIMVMALTIELVVMLAMVAIINGVNDGVEMIIDYLNDEKIF